ncbi:helix-turn-helix domain-containing protein [Pedobacter sp. SYP-B3415]|uniref:winged helix-turn-helix transcriptional regulator n=1 Tax=Pedobacter sp. SYP-B3415 TaxID=2496641 RepID=UPI00101D470C|nr:helix-turn-helix domain-containing protein [Pedobacter sp. SYP-B3415]
MSTSAEQCFHTDEPCASSVSHISDALYVLGGKWKLALIFAISESPKRFGELQKILEGIGPKMLAKDLKELELNEFIVRKVYEGTPPRIVYEATPYSASLARVLFELKDWGMKHRETIRASMRRHQ